MSDFLVKKAAGRTRIGQGRYEYIDAIVARTPLDIPIVKTVKRKIPLRTYSLMKGLLITQSALYEANASTLFAYLLHQVAGDADAAWIEQNAHHLYRIIGSVGPDHLGKIVSVVRNHDEDVQVAPSTANRYRNWRATADRRTEQAKSLPRTQRQCLTEWSRNTRSAQNSTAEANAIRTRRALPIVPHLWMMTEDGTEATPTNIDAWETRCDEHIRGKRKGRKRKRKEEG